MQTAWKEAGSQVTFVSARLLRIALRICRRSFQVVSVYAPTFNDTDQDKEQFYQQLQTLLSSFSSKDEVVIMGDFNARVGTRSSRGVHDQDALNPEDLVVGPHGNSELNDNGRLLLDFCRSQRTAPLRIMSTYFQHKFYGTWQHNRTKLWHQIDHVLTTAQTAQLITDVKSMPGIDFDSDHLMARVSLRVMPICKQPWGRKQRMASATQPRLAKLQVHRLTDPSVRTKFNDKLEELVGDGLTDEYSLFSYGIRKAGEFALGTITHSCRPQWQLDNAEQLAQISARKQQAYMDKETTLNGTEYYRQVRKECKVAVIRILNQWWDQQASQIEQDVKRNSAKQPYEGIALLRKTLHPPCKPPQKLRNSNGHLLDTADARSERWREHFEALLNVQKSVHPDSLSRLSSKPECSSLADPLTFGELLAAVHCLKQGKAPGPDGVQGELLKALKPSLLRVLYEFFCRVWDGVEPVPHEWKVSYLVPLPKKGDLTLCGKWRGILLSSTVGKLFSKILAGRLSTYFEEMSLLPETQCGFRAGRSTMNMVFTLRMAMDLARLKQFPLYIIFVDLQKAYDSVSRRDMWTLLRIKGVPEKMVDAIRSFYEGKEACVCSEGRLSDSFSLQTGLGQGCCLAPFLFNVFLAAVMEDWESRVRNTLRWPYRIDGLLKRGFDEGSLAKYASWEILQLHDLGYADDAAFITDTYQKLCELAPNLQTLYILGSLCLGVCSASRVLALRCFKCSFFPLKR